MNSYIPQLTILAIYARSSSSSILKILILLWAHEQQRHWIAVGNQKLVFKGWSSKVGLQKINIVFLTNKLVISKTKVSILNI